MTGVRNFLFHRVHPQREKLWDPMDVALFDKCIRHITAHYKVALLEDIAFSGELSSNKEKYATIMFDDGYKDNLEFAAPILKKYHAPASFYVVTDCIDKNIPPWTFILEYIFQHTRKSNLDFHFDFLPPELNVQILNTVDDRIAFVIKLKPFLKKLPHEQREQVLQKVQQQFDDVTLPPLMMNWQDLQQLRSEGHYVGSHTVTHAMLGTMSNEQELQHELQQSADRIKTELGYFPKTISYPVGSFNTMVKKCSEQAGYQIGLAVKQNIYYPQQDDIYEVPRIELYNEPWWKTRLRISNTLEDIKSIIRYR